MASMIIMAGEADSPFQKVRVFVIDKPLDEAYKIVHKKLNAENPKLFPNECGSSHPGWKGLKFDCEDGIWTAYDDIEILTEENCI